MEQLREYRTGTGEPPDLDGWWRRRLDQARAAAREPALTRYQADTYAPVDVVPAAHVERQLRHLREFLR